MEEPELDDHLGNYSCEDCGHHDCLSLYQRADDTFYGICRSECHTTNSGHKGQEKLATWECGEDLGIPKNIKQRKTSVTIRSKSKKKKVSKSPPITEEEFSGILESSSEEGGNFRNVPNSILKFLKIRTGYGGEGEVTRRYYQVTSGDPTQGYTIVGVHVRNCVEKKFWSVGKNGTDVNLFNQSRCKNSKRLLITGGPEDVAAALHIINKQKKANHAPIDIVSGSCGETNLPEQIRTNYDFIDRYEEVILDYDNDKAGVEVKNTITEILPRKKLKVMQPIGNYKDASDIKQEPDRTARAAAEQQYMANLYAAQSPVLAGTVDPASYWELMTEALHKPKIPLPPCFSTLQKMLVGGLPSGEIINILAGSGIGKTTIANTLLRYWRFESPYSMAIFSLEAGTGKFLNRLMSGHIGVNLALIEDPMEAEKVLLDNKDKIDSLLYLEDGSPSFTLVDDKGDLDSLDKVQRLTEAVIQRDERELIIFDPVSDLLDGLTREDQEKFITWEKKIKGMYGVTLLNIVHARKGNSGKNVASQGGELTEEDMQGTSAIFKSAAVNIIFTRDKTSDDPLIRNTVKIMNSKSRDAGVTGPAGVLIYDLNTGTFQDGVDYVDTQEEASTNKTIKRRNISG